jgi:phosphoribosylformimino-5-aminoimidazole carboxamide ribotide isomerase
MRVIPVIDLLNGCVVRGIGGRRDEYRPIKSQIAAGAQPATVARAFVERFGCDTVYVADLDAIQSPLDEKQYWVACWQEIAAAGLTLWLDAGIRHASDARQLRESVDRSALDVHYIVGLESLADIGELRGIAAELGRERTIFSLDLKNGQPIKPIVAPGLQQPEEIVYCVLAHGISRVIVLDLADVGMWGGTGTLPLCSRIRQEFGSAVEIIAGGGVRGLADLQALADADCNAALVASALHDGRLTAADLRAAEAMTSRWSRPGVERERPSPAQPEPRRSSHR